MDTAEKSKKRDIAELIRLMTSQSNLMEPNVSKFVQHSLASNKDVNQYIRKNLEKLLVPFDETFTHDEVILLISFYNEIKRLIAFYQSRAMCKLLRRGRELFDPIYEVYHQGYMEMQKQGESNDSDM